MEENAISLAPQQKVIWGCFSPALPGKGISSFDGESCRDCSCAYLDGFIYFFCGLPPCQPIHLWDQSPFRAIPNPAAEAAAKANISDVSAPN